MNKGGGELWDVEAGWGVGGFREGPAVKGGSSCSHRTFLQSI